MSQPLLKEIVFAAFYYGPRRNSLFSDVNKNFMFSLDLCKFLNIVLNEF